MNYDNLKKSELIELCEKRKLMYSSSLTKDKLIEILLKADELVASNKLVENHAKLKGNVAAINESMQNAETQTNIDGEYNLTYKVDDQEGLTNYAPEYHTTIVAFLLNIAYSFATSFVLLGAMFYWPLARKWFAYIGKYCWGWTITFSLWAYTIMYFILIIVYVFTIVLIPFAIVIFFFWKSLFKGLKIGRNNREIYAQKYLKNRQ